MDPKKSEDNEFDFLQEGKTKEATDNNSMLEIIRNQRDRFAKRIQELESENNNFNQKMSNTQQEIDSLRKDNLALYEKVRYLSSYKTLSNNNNSGSQTDTEVPMEEINSSYRDMYEESVHPFAVFSRKERSQRIQNLNTAEKVVYTSSQFFLSSKETRLILFFYSVFLHLLVFWCLFRLMTIEAEKHTNIK